VENIDNIIEIKRGLHKVCGRKLVNAIADLEKCEAFFKDLFVVYGLIYNTETLIQKRVFVAAVTKYFILDRLPEEYLLLNEGKYEYTTKAITKPLEQAVDTYFAIRSTSDSSEDFKKKYAENFNEEVKDFSKEISENRDDSLSDFAKTIKKIYYSKDENTDC